MEFPTDIQVLRYDKTSGLSETDFFYRFEGSAKYTILYSGQTPVLFNCRGILCGDCYFDEYSCSACFNKTAEKPSALKALAAFIDEHPEYLI